VSHGDSPGGGRPQPAWESCGIAAAARELELEARTSTSGAPSISPLRRTRRGFTLESGALAAAGIVNLCKLENAHADAPDRRREEPVRCIAGSQKKVLHVLHPTPAGVSAACSWAERAWCARACTSWTGWWPWKATARAAAARAPWGCCCSPPNPVALDAVMCRLWSSTPGTCPPRGRGGPGGRHVSGRTRSSCSATP